MVLEVREGSLAEIAVVMIEPIPAWRSKEVDVLSIFKSCGGVGHVGRDHQEFSGANDDGLAGDDELESAGENKGDLLVDMAVPGDDATRTRTDA